MTGACGWTSAAPHDAAAEPPVPFDATRPNVTSAYDYLLGGHLGALVAKGDDLIRDVPGDLTDPRAVLSALQATGLIDWNRPVCLILAMVLPFLGPCRIDWRDLMRLLKQTFRE